MSNEARLRDAIRFSEMVRQHKVRWLEQERAMKDTIVLVVVMAAISLSVAAWVLGLTQMFRWLV